MKRRQLVVQVITALALLCFSVARAGAQNATALFDQANKLYEQARYLEAASVYEKLLPSERSSAALYFNLGNAWFKAGQSGRAIAAYRQAERLAPRDPNLRFNLNFVRRKVSGTDTAPIESWQHWLATLTLNEWTVLAMGAFWVWFLMLALRELRPGLRRSLGGYTATAGAVSTALVGALALVVYQQSRIKEAVVIATNAIVRYGPLEESHVFYQLRDGSEVTVLDEKDLNLGDKRQSWLQVQDATHRIGWVQRDQVILLATTQPLKPANNYVSR